MPVIIEPVGPPGAGDPRPPLLRRLGWFFAIAAAAAAATALVAYLMKALLPVS